MNRGCGDLLSTVQPLTDSAVNGFAAMGARLERVEADSERSRTRYLVRDAIEARSVVIIQQLDALAGKTYCVEKARDAMHLSKHKPLA
jgi:hypothetical protein